LEDRWNEEKTQYFFSIQMAMATDPGLSGDPELASAKSILERDSFNRFHEEKLHSVHDTLSKKDNGDREFNQYGHKHSTRIVHCGE